MPTRFLLCRDDRLFPAAFQRRVVRERLDITPDEMDGGHLPGLARPLELAARLEEYVIELEASADGPGMAGDGSRGGHGRSCRLGYGDRRTRGVASWWVACVAYWYVSP